MDGPKRVGASAVPDDPNASVFITQPANTSGTAKIVVTAPNAASQTYTVEFTVAAPILSYDPVCPDIAASTKNLIFITNGWNDAATSTDSWAQQMARAVTSFIDDPRNGLDPSSWAVCAYDWHVGADTGSNFLTDPPLAYYNGGQVGLVVGHSLAKDNLAYIHFIAHSAGSNVIQTAAETIAKDTAYAGVPQPKIHLTFLNAYDPSGDQTPGHHYGENPNDPLGLFDNTDWWAEQYVDTSGNGVPEYSDATMRLTHAFNFDLSSLNTYDPYIFDWNGTGIQNIANELNNFIVRHNWAYAWYQNSIIAPIGSASEITPPDTSPITYPLPDKFSYGFPFSTEGGTSYGFLRQYPINGYCLLTTETQYICPASPVRTMAYSDASAYTNGSAEFANPALNTPSLTGNVIYSDSTEILADPYPVWSKTIVTTTGTANLMRFYYHFLSPSRAQGMLTVTVDGQLVYEADESLAPAGNNQANDIWVGNLAAGQHAVVFRFDPEGNISSTVQISDVEFGFNTVKQITDSVAPTTIAIISGAPGKSGWYTSNVSIALNAADNPGGVGVESTDYSLDDGPWQAYASTTPISIASEGVHTLQFYSTDYFGNQEATSTVEIKIDKTPPQLELRANPSILWPPNGKMVSVAIGGFATDTVSGINSVFFKIADEYGKVMPAISDFGSIIQLEASRNGNDSDGRTYTVSAIATDNAGNQATTSVTVLVPHDQRVQ